MVLKVDQNVLQNAVGNRQEIFLEVNHILLQLFLHETKPASKKCCIPMSNNKFVAEIFEFEIQRLRLGPCLLGIYSVAVLDFRLS